MLKIPNLQRVSAVALFCLALLPGALASVGELRQILVDQNVPVPEASLKASLEEAFIRAIDPGAQILAAVPTNAAPQPQADALSDVEYLPGDILYLTVNALNGQASHAMHTALDAWTNTTETGIIIDLRNAGGSDLADVDAVAGIMLTPGEPLYTVENGNREVLETHLAEGPPPPTNALPPCILLIGTNTQDAAEVLAACLVQRQGIMLIGAPTLGHTALRESLPLPDGRVLRIATRWIIPVERPAFQGTGVMPHLEVIASAHSSQPRPAPRRAAQRPMSERTKLQRQLFKRVAGDAVLRRAADLLLSLKALHNHNTSDSVLADESP